MTQNKIKQSNPISNSHEESRFVKKIFETIKEGNRHCVEIGASDGRTESNTYHLVSDQGWASVQIEADPKKYKDLLAMYKNNSTVICINQRVCFEGINKLDLVLLGTPVPQNFDLLSIDVDGNDYHIWESLEQYEPKVVIIEFNPSIPDDIEFVQPKDMRTKQGSSLRSLIHLGEKKGYELIASFDYNAIFCRKEYVELLRSRGDQFPCLFKKRDQYETRLFQLFDGTLVLSGCKHLLWHQIEMNEKKMQVLPKFLRQYPADLNLFSQELSRYGWKGIFSFMKRIMRTRFAQMIKHTFLYPLIQSIREHRRMKQVLSEWERQGRPIPPPFELKQKTIKEYARRFSLDTFVETGTFHGYTIEAVQNTFRKIISIELSEALYEEAKEKFSKSNHVSIVHGDSGEVLRDVLMTISEPCLFWLDAHWSEGISARGKADSPAKEELRSILKHPIKKHVILIDDERLFAPEHGFPSVHELREMVSHQYPDWVFEIKDDIIRVHGK